MNESTKLHPAGHGGDIMAAAEAAGLPPESILDFSASINPFGPPPGLPEFLARHWERITRYPDPSCRAFIAAVKKAYHPVNPVLAGNGAAELIYLACRLAAPGKVLLPAPTFSLYAKAARAAGAEVEQVVFGPESGFHVDVDVLGRHVRWLRPSLVILCNPNNPTGFLHRKEEVLALYRECEAAGSLFMVDEAFLEFCPEHDRLTLLGEKGNMLVLRSLTKMFALPGLRLGFISGPEKALAQMAALRDPWGVSAVAQLAGEYVLADMDFVRQSVNGMIRLRERLAEGIAQVGGFLVFPSAANYLFIKSSYTGVQEFLLKRGILVRDCGTFYGLDSRYLRVAVRSEEENRRLLAAISAIPGEM